jgi:DNA-binding transcriptional regulator YiaG
MSVISLLEGNMSVEEILELAERPKPPPPEEARRILRERGVQVRELAEAMGVHPVTLSKWLAGSQKPTGDRATVYAHALALLKAKTDQP